jgi:hypothetical protein
MKEKTKKYDFAKLSVRPQTKREIDIMAAMQQRHVYEIVDEMLNSWKAASALPRPIEAQGASVPQVQG